MMYDGQIDDFLASATDGLMEIREHIETIRQANKLLHQRIRAHEQYEGFWFWKRLYTPAPGTL